MNWIDRLEQKYGRKAIPDITKYFAIALGIGFVIQLFAPFLTGIMMFSVADILRGQVRFVTWIITPPMGSQPLLAIVFLVCLIPMSRTLEMFLGSFRMNFIFWWNYRKCNWWIYCLFCFVFGIRSRNPIYLSTYHILITLFMALAIMLPDATVHLYFILPIKMKWMLLIYGANFVYEIVTYFKMGPVIGLALASETILALVNFFLFFFMTGRVSRKQKKRKKEFEQQFRSATPRPGSGITQHKCSICGRTELDDPNLSFRYCSKCAGSHEYCQDHLFTHKHVGGGDFTIRIKMVSVDKDELRFYNKG